MVSVDQIVRSHEHLSGLDSTPQSMGKGLETTSNKGDGSSRSLEDGLDEDQ